GHADHRQLRLGDGGDPRLRRVVHDLQVVERAERLLPAGPARGARVDDRLDLHRAVREVEARVVALVVVAVERAAGARIVVGADRAPGGGVARGDGRVPRGEGLEGGPEARPAEGVRRSGRRRGDEAADRVALAGELLNPGADRRHRVAGAARVDHRAVAEEGAGAGLEGDVVHRLLRVLVRLDGRREAGDVVAEGGAAGHAHVERRVVVEARIAL